MWGTVSSLAEMSLKQTDTRFPLLTSSLLVLSPVFLCMLAFVCAFKHSTILQTTGSRDTGLYDRGSSFSLPSSFCSGLIIPIFVYLVWRISIVLQFAILVSG